MPGYYNSPWPCEDGDPTRKCTTHTDSTGLALDPHKPLGVVEREVFSTTMTVLRDPGEVYVLGHSLGADTVGWVEQIDPETLEPIHRSPNLEAGPFWPGGIAAHANGDLYVTYGSWCHRLSADCKPVASEKLPRDRAYNSLTILDGGVLVMKDIVRDESVNSHLVVLDPDRLDRLGPEVECPEPSVARLTSSDNSVYLVGTSTVYRYHWDADRNALDLDSSWRVPYRTDPGQSYGWDPVLADGFVWFMDNGAHNYSSTMRGAGVAPGPVHLICASLDSGEVVAEEVSGEPGGAITNPPLIDTGRKIAIAYDSANGYLTAWRYTCPSEPGRASELSRLFQVELDTACHLLLYVDQGILVANDHSSGTDAVVFIEIETGEEISRAATTSPAQSVLFLSPGWDRDLYYCSFARLARVFNLGDQKTG